MTLLDELAEETKRIDGLMADLNKQVKSFIVDEFSLLDLVASEETNDETLREIKETIDRIIKIRQLLSLETADNHYF